MYVRVTIREETTGGAADLWVADEQGLAEGPSSSTSCCTGGAIGAFIGVAEEGAQAAERMVNDQGGIVLLVQMTADAGERLQPRPETEAPATVRLALDAAECRILAAILRGQGRGADA